MQTYHQWIWQHPSWPNLVYNAKDLLPSLTTLANKAGALEATCRTLTADVLLDSKARVIAEDALETSAIEGELLHRSSVRASIRKKLGLPVEHDDSTVQTDSLVAMLMDARDHADQPLHKERLFSWHAALFPTGYSGLSKIRVGQYRGNEEMQIVSGSIGKERIHYIAPARKNLDDEMACFLKWLNSKDEPEPMLKAGIAHLWFIMIHPFDDGNGRIGRAITDYVLSSQNPLLMQVISFSRQVSQDQAGYYQVLEKTGKGNLDITQWLLWFIDIMLGAIKESGWVIEQVVQKARFWERYCEVEINNRQRKMLNRLLDTGKRFTGGMTTRKYAGMTRCSKVTASRDLKNLLERGILCKRAGGGRNTSYELNMAQK